MPLAANRMDLATVVALQPQIRVRISGSQNIQPVYESFVAGIGVGDRVITGFDGGGKLNILGVAGGVGSTAKVAEESGSPKKPLLNEDIKDLLSKAATERRNAYSEIADFLQENPLDGTAIKEGSISSQHILANSLLGDSIVARTLNASAIVSRSITAEQISTLNLRVGQDIVSSNFRPGQDGWRIRGDGTFELQGGLFRGEIASSDLLVRKGADWLVRLSDDLADVSDLSVSEDKKRDQLGIGWYRLGAGSGPSRTRKFSAGIFVEEVSEDSAPLTFSSDGGIGWEGSSPFEVHRQSTKVSKRRNRVAVWLNASTDGRFSFQPEYIIPYTSIPANPLTARVANRAFAIVRGRAVTWRQGAPYFTFSRLVEADSLPFSDYQSLSFTSFRSAGDPPVTQVYNFITGSQDEDNPSFYAVGLNRTGIGNDSTILIREYTLENKSNGKGASFTSRRGWRLKPSGPPAFRSGQYAVDGGVLFGIGGLDLDLGSGASDQANGFFISNFKNNVYRDKVDGKDDPIWNYKQSKPFSAEAIANIGGWGGRGEALAVNTVDKSLIVVNRWRPDSSQAQLRCQVWKYVLEDENHVAWVGSGADRRPNITRVPGEDFTLDFSDFETPKTGTNPQRLGGFSIAYHGSDLYLLLSTTPQSGDLKPEIGKYSAVSSLSTYVESDATTRRTPVFGDMFRSNGSSWVHFGTGN